MRKTFFRNIAAVILMAVMFNSLPVQISADTEKTSDITDVSASTIAHRLILNGNIGIKFYLNIDEAIAQSSGAYALLSANDRKSAIIPLNEAVTEEISVGGTAVECYVFEYDVAVTQITADVTLKLFLSDGSLVYTDTYSVYEYAQKVLDGTYEDTEKPEELRELIRSMLNFGGYAQKYFGYNLSSLANTGLYSSSDDPVLNSDIDFIISDYAFSMSPQFPEGLVYVSSALKLDSDTSICFYFRVEEGYDISDFKFSCSLTKQTSIEPLYDEALGAYRVTVGGIAAPDLADTYTLQIKASPTNGYITYIPLHYTELVLRKSSNAALCHTVKALYFYYEASNNYFNGN